MEQQKTEVDFHSFEHQAADEIKSNMAARSIFFGRMTWRQRLASVIHFFVVKFTMNRKWQIGLVIYLLISVSLGTCDMIKAVVSIAIPFPG